MRLLDTDTRYFDEEVPGIPTLINQWGAMINILDFLFSGRLSRKTRAFY